MVVLRRLERQFEGRCLPRLADELLMALEVLERPWERLGSSALEDRER
jgi:hypothetical protein